MHQIKLDFQKKFVTEGFPKSGHILYDKYLIAIVE